MITITVVNVYSNRSRLELTILDLNDSIRVMTDMYRDACAVDIISALHTPLQTLLEPEKGSRNVYRIAGMLVNYLVGSIDFTRTRTTVKINM